MPSIVVIGSINMDLVCRTPRIPKPGETVMGKHDLVTVPGGKGANQAVAAARLGGNVHLVARVGEDEFGNRLITGLQENGVSCTHVHRTANTSSGCATILVDDHGENSIVVAPGANAKLTPEDIDAAENLIRDASIVLVQLEVPFKTVKHVLTIARRHEVFTMLDPAPAPVDLPKALYHVDIMTPNQTEAEKLLGQAVRRRRKAIDAKADAADLIARGPRNVILKLGAAGCLVVTSTGEITRVKSFKTKVVDTTAAGDAFTGALAVAYTEGKSLPDAARFANAAGAIACTTFGAQPSLPRRDAVDRLLLRSR